MSDNRIGYAVRMTNDGVVSFVRASERDRIRGKILCMVTIIERELPSSKLLKGTQIPELIHEPNDDVLGAQLMLCITKAAPVCIPEIIITGVYLDKDGNEEHVARVLIVYRMRDSVGEEDRYGVPLSTWGIT